MKKIIPIILLAAALVCALAACSKTEMPHPEGVELKKEGNELISVERVGNNAVYKCSVNVKNDTDKNMAVKLVANFPDEYKSGMYAIDFAVGKVDGSELLLVPANDSTTVEAVFEIAFAASYKGDAVTKTDGVPAIAINEYEVDSDLLPPFSE